MSAHVSVRCRNALASGAAALVTLLGMTLWVGKLDNFTKVVLSGIGLWFLGISFVALALGACLSARRVHWSLLVGTLAGLVGGTAIVLSIMSTI